MYDSWKKKLEALLYMSATKFVVIRMWSYGPELHKLTTGWEYLCVEILKQKFADHCQLFYEGWNFNNGNTAVETPCNGTK
jgi:hypothetical protein